MQSQHSHPHADSSEVIQGGVLNQFPDTEEGRLGSLCRDLRDDITTLLRNGKGGDAHKRKRIYNELVDALRNLQFHPRVDPLNRLPYEIFIRILLELRCSSSILSTAIIELLPLTMVSTKWRDCILSEPLLWNEIHIFYGYDEHLTIPLQLHLSRDLPLTLVVPIELNGWDNIRPHLHNHRDRIESIIFARYFSDDMADHQKMGADIRLFLDDLKPLPRLRRLIDADTSNETGGIYDVKWLSQCFQSLKELVHISLTSKDLQETEGTLNITNLVTFDDPCTILPIARTINSLRKVAFRRPELKETVYHKDLSWNSQLDWTELSFWADPCSTPLSLLGCLSKLVHLSIMTANIDTLVVAINKIHQLVALSHFQIDIRLDETPSLDPQEISMLEAPQSESAILQRINPNCRNFGVNTLIASIFCYQYDGNEDGREQQGSKLEMDIQTIVKLLLHAMPKVEHLHFTLVYEIPFRVLPLPRLPLDGHFNGRNLSLHLANTRLIPSEKSHIPASVHTLRVYTGKDSVSFLSSNFVKYLHISLQSDRTYDELQLMDRLNTWSAVEYDHSRPNPDFMIDLNAWSALESIHTTSNHIHWIQWERASLTFLRRVSIQTHFPYDFTASDGTTSFIRDIACRPDSYPSLEEIRLSECPEWDILMIMLERRNLMTRPNVKRIRKISFLTICPFEIRRIIRTLLQGKWPERPSNWELSMAGNAEIMQDKEM
jgi:hypothetical protein